MGDLRGSHERRFRRDVSNQQVLDLVEKGFSDIRVAIMLDVSSDLVRRARLGLRKDPTTPSAPRIPEAKRCKACGQRRIANGNRYLCSTCFERNNETIYDSPFLSIAGST